MRACDAEPPTHLHRRLRRTQAAPKLARLTQALSRCHRRVRAGAHMDLCAAHARQQGCPPRCSTCCCGHGGSQQQVTCAAASAATGRSRAGRPCQVHGSRQGSPGGSSCCQAAVMLHASHMQHANLSNAGDSNNTCSAIQNYRLSNVPCAQPRSRMQPATAASGGC